ncbi:MAG: precorrin-6y C5,15-methyltransferase (decarboxylating) subunit CbiE [Spirochaetia bacterium]|nr:precorrin-6y C5,15-methyltransferase (decarboxylating) subunit CbiE [Spirochaetia bacterium]
MKNNNKKINIKIIGIDEAGKNYLSPNVIDMIYKSSVMMGAERLLANFPDYKGKLLAIKNTVSHKLADMVEALKSENQDAVVLASGDPLFFGIGGYLRLKFSEQNYNIEIFPSVSSLQLAFSKIAASWQDACSISLHGRKIQGLAQKIVRQKKVFILTDPENHPGKIAEYMREYNLTNYRAFVAENLGMDNEKTAWYSIEDLVQKSSKDFSDLNVIILIQNDGKEEKLFTLGIADHEFSFPEKPDGLITKKEIRVLALGAMNLQKNSVVWDIGSCTGSIAIEAARIAYEGQVYAVEKNPEHLAHCYKNSRKFHADVYMIEKDAPDGLEELDDPDSVFIGGSGGHLREILEVCSRKLRPNGRIVVNAATLETLQDAISHFKKLGFQAEISMTQISRSRPVGDLTRFQSLNPVFILTACRDNHF